MAIRLAKDLAAQNNENPTSFNLVFTDNTTYNLDYIVEYRNRTNPNAKLVLEVKDDATLAQRALEELKSNLYNDITTTLSKEDVIAGVAEIIKGIYNKHMSLFGTMTLDYMSSDLDTDNLPFDVYRELKNEVNDYLKGLVVKYDLDFSIKAKSGQPITIFYRFKNDDALDRLFEQYLDEYRLLYNKGLTDVKEGGLAISNNSTTNKIPVRMADESKYVLDNNNLSPKPNISEYSVDINYNSKKGDIIWEDGEVDERTSDDEISIFDELERAEKASLEKSEVIQSLREEMAENAEDLTHLEEYRTQNIILNNRVSELETALENAAEQGETDGYEIIEKIF